MRWLFDVVTGYGPGKMNKEKWLTRVVFLETIAGVLLILPPDDCLRCCCLRCTVSLRLLLTRLGFPFQQVSCDATVAAHMLHVPHISLHASHFPCAMCACCTTPWQASELQLRLSQLAPNAILRKRDAAQTQCWRLQGCRAWWRA